MGNSMKDFFKKLLDLQSQKENRLLADWIN